MKRSKTIGKDDIMVMVIGLIGFWILFTSVLIALGVPFFGAMLIVAGIMIYDIWKIG